MLIYWEKLRHLHFKLSFLFLINNKNNKNNNNNEYHK